MPFLEPIRREPSSLQLTPQVRHARCDDFGQERGVAPVGIKIGVEYCDLRSDRSGGERLEKFDELFRVEPARIRAVNGRHEAGVEHVNIEVQPVTGAPSGGPSGSRHLGHSDLD